MKKDLICIICPRGCSMSAEIKGDEISVSGNACPKGQQYAIDECTNPTRTVTSTIRVENREDTMVSVKTENPIPKGEIFKLMEKIRSASCLAPIKIGDIIISDVHGTNIIATKEIE